jgi:hypothetical protein
MTPRFLVTCFSLLVACSSDKSDTSNANSTGTGGTPPTGGTNTGGSTAKPAGGTPAATGGSKASAGGAMSAGGAATGGVAAGGTSAGGAGKAAGGASGGAGGAPGGTSAGGGAKSEGGSSAGAPSGGSGGAGTGCGREAQAAILDSYLKALVKHDPAGVPIADTVKYTENTKAVTVGEGLWKNAGEPKLVRSLFDTETCNSVTQVVLPEGGKDSVMSLRLKLDSGKISEIEAIITRQGDFLFSAEGYAKSVDQKWEVLPEDQRNTRDELLAAAKAYFDLFSDMSVEVPWGMPCQRLEGGAMTFPCTQGVPSGVTIGNRRYWADVETGVSVGFVLFGGSTSGLLDAHYFRLIDGTIRNVYSMTSNTTYMTTGWPQGSD